MQFSMLGFPISENVYVYDYSDNNTIKIPAQFIEMFNTI